jgi:hypothetical protein
MKALPTGRCMRRLLVEGDGMIEVARTSQRR